MRWRREGGGRGQAQQPVFEVSSSYLPSSLSQLSKMSTLFTMGGGEREQAQQPVFELSFLVDWATPPNRPKCQYFSQWLTRVF